MLLSARCCKFQKKDGFRDYVILHLLYDSGARAQEAGNIKMDDIDYIVDFESVKTLFLFFLKGFQFFIESLFFSHVFTGIL